MNDLEIGVQKLKEAVKRPGYREFFNSVIEKRPDQLIGLLIGVAIGIQEELFSSVAYELAEQIVEKGWRP